MTGQADGQGDGAQDAPLLAEAAGWVRTARRVCVLTGAGVSAESGVPTFRDALDGLWARYNPEELATEAGFRANPGLVWAWYASRRDAVARVAPNPAHLALAQAAQARPGWLDLVTQNVDGLHQRAGSPDVMTLHGDLFADRWLDDPGPGGCTHVAPADAQAGEPPTCPRCGTLLRPGVVWFGEMLPARTLERAEQAASACELMLVIGTSGLVYPAAGLPMRARQAGARVVVVNTQASDLDDVAHAVLRRPAGWAVPRLLAQALA